MTSANNAAPAAVFPGTIAITATATHDEIGVVMGDFNDERAALDAILALMCSSEHAETDPALGSAAMLLRITIERISVVQQNLDRVSINEYHRALKKEPVPAPAENVALKNFGGEVCRRVSAVSSMLSAALELMRKNNHDQSYREIFSGCEVIETAATLLYDLSGDAVDAGFTTKTSQRGNV